MLRPTAVTGVVLAAALLTAGCSGSAAGEPSATASSTSASTSPEPTTSPSASPSGTAVDTFEILPESALATLPDFAYVTADGQDGQVQSQGANPSVSRVFSGAIARQLMFGGQEVGGVQVWRFRDDVPVTAKAQLLTFMVGGFGGKEAVTGTLNGVPVAQVEQARKSQITAVGFLTNTDMILVWSAGTEAAQRLSVLYMAAAGLTEVVGESGSPSPSASAS
ncbi:hypothetical protein [Longivirga aurantiaca]|uniref:Uncharacterized protein n=1 Tax=Longivirga aurantiaca TaxID=1837743 RepID=A0ABW1T1X9_9ACTN